MTNNKTMLDIAKDEYFDDLKTENDIMHAIQVELSKHNIKVFRANVIGSYTKDGRYIPPSLPKGFSDLFGTMPDGTSIYIETKRPDHKTNKEHLKRQQNFLNQMKKNNALVGFAESVDDALKIVGVKKC